MIIFLSECDCVTFKALAGHTQYISHGIIKLSNRGRFPAISFEFRFPGNHVCFMVNDVMSSVN